MGTGTMLVGTGREWEKEHGNGTGTGLKSSSVQNSNGDSVRKYSGTCTAHTEFY